MKSLLPIYIFGYWAALTAGFVRAQTMPSTSPSASTRPVSLPPEIAAALKYEAEAFARTITVAWSELKDPPLTPKEYASVIGYTNFDHRKTFAEEQKVNLTWQSDGRYLLGYQELYHPSGTNRTVPRFNIHYSFDGKMFYEHDSNPDELHALAYFSFAGDADAGHYINMDYFSFIGFPLPASPNQLQKHVAVQSDILNLLQGDEYHLAAIEACTVDKEPMVRLSFQRRDIVSSYDAGDDTRAATEDFYLDPARGYAKVREVGLNVKGTMVYQIDCSDFREFAGQGVFLPGSVLEVDRESGLNDPPSRSTLTVKNIGFTPLPPASFTPTENAPGSWIVDWTGAKPKTFVLQKDGLLKPMKNDPNYN